MNHSILSTLAVLSLISFTSLSHAANLLANGGMEEGIASSIASGCFSGSAAIGWNGCFHANTTSFLTSRHQAFSGVSPVEGQWMLEVNVNGRNSGVYQGNALDQSGLPWNSSAVHTFSGWLYVIRGNVWVGLGSDNSRYNMSAHQTLGRWEYFSLTSGPTTKVGVALVYSGLSAASGAQLLLDGLWLNEGAVSTNPAAVPEPMSLGLLFLGCAGPAWGLKRRLRK